MAQQASAEALRTLRGSDPELVAEETLVLLAVASARAVVDGAPVVADVLLDVPAQYHDYLLGTSIVGLNDPSAANNSHVVYDRLAARRRAYEHLMPPDWRPDEATLEAVLKDWLLRISPPSAPGAPRLNLSDSGLLHGILTHLRLIHAYAQQKSI